MAVDGGLLRCDGHLFKQMAEAGLAWLEANQERVNQLNVFPVPDGDTGTNMFLTMRKAYDEITDLDEPHIGKVSQKLSYGARLGARGNSGVILSEWLRGFAEALEDQAAFDSVLFAQACQRAVERSYKSVVSPVEGTILTVSRQAMEAVIERAKVEHDINVLFETKVQAAYESLRHTPDLLPMLKEAGVVDSGGQGWTFIIEGMLRSLRGEETRFSGAQAVAAQKTGWQDALVPEDEQGYGYDVQFLMRGEGLDVDSVRKAIADIGWSALVVGDPRLIKVHVHVHDPGVPISYAIQQGAAIDDVVVENMQQQYQSYVAHREARENQPPKVVEGVAVIAVTSGEGISRMFTDELGAASVVVGGQTMNPSIETFLNAIKALPNDEIILLPNNPNVIMAARQVVSLAEGKTVRVVPSRTIPQGVVAMFEYSNEHESGDIDAIAEAMTAALANVITIEVTTATRTTTLNGIYVRESQLIGLIDDQMAAAGDAFQPLLKTLLEKAGADKRELITLYYGDVITGAEAQTLSDQLAGDFAAQEFQIVNGGQPLYPYIVSIE
ncbi:MAG: DAK2 domain-containing protein [Chloroflexota bacterium]